MPLRPRATAELSSDDAIAPIDADPRFSQLATMRKAIMDALTRRRQMIELLGLEAGIARPTTSQTGPRVQQMRERAALLRALLETKNPDPDADSGLPLPLQRAMALAAGAPVEEPETDVKRMARLRGEERALEAGLSAISEQMDVLRDQLSLEVAERLVPAHQQVLRSVWEAAAALSAALDRESQLFATPIVAGYVPRPDVLCRPGLRSGALLGSLQMWDSEVSNFRRRLEAAGLLP